MATLRQDVSTVEVEQRDFDPVPAGNYRAQIIESDVVDTKSGDGQMLKLTFVLLDPPYENRRVWDQLCIVHSNPTTQTIAQQRLKSICDAIGHNGQVEESEELHDQPMLIRINIEQRDANYPPRNAVKGIKSADAAPPAGKPAPQAAAKQAPAASKPAASDKPWLKGRAA